MKRFFSLFIFLFGLAVFSFGLDQVIYTTIPPLAGLINSILGTSVARSVVPEGIDPHHFSVSVSRLRELLHTREVFALNGRLELEEKIISPIEEWKGHPDIFFVARDVPVLDDDPHIWLSLRNLKIMTQAISRHLSVQATPLLNRIQRLDERFQELFSRMPGKAFLCLHPAWRYFARDYGLEMISVLGYNGEVGPGRLARIMEECRKKSIRFILVERQFNRDLVEPIIQSCDLKVIIVNPLATDIVGEFSRIAEALEGVVDENR